MTCFLKDKVPMDQQADLDEEIDEDDQPSLEVFTAISNYFRILKISPPNGAVELALSYFRSIKT